MISYSSPEFEVEIKDDLCIRCGACVVNCSFDALEHDEDDDRIVANNRNCVDCRRCAVFCPTLAINIYENGLAFRKHGLWTNRAQREINKQAETGGVLLTSCGNELPSTTHPIYWDHLLLDASQVTNPSIDPLREPMELRTYLGSKPDAIEIDDQGKVKAPNRPSVALETPIMFAAMSFGAISYNVHKSLALAATEAGTLYNTGEGGLHPSLYEYGDNTIVQVASGRYGVFDEYLKAGQMIEIKVGQGAKPGIGGHLPGEKIDAEISLTRMIPEGTDAISPAPHHDVYSIEDLRQLVMSLKEATNYEKLVAVKIAAVHNAAPIASGIARAGADVIVIDGFRGGTGATPTVIRDNVGIPIELALAAVDDRLRQEGIRNQVSVVVSGGIRNSADVAKAIALGADAVYIGTAALIALGCTVCQRCFTGKCAWGLTTQDRQLNKRVNPEEGSERLYNLLRGWSIEIKDILGAMGVNAIESLRGNRLRLRGVGLDEETLKILGVRPAGK